MRSFLKIFALFLLVSLILSGIGAFLYWRHLTTTPQYSLAMIIEASRNKDQQKIDQLIDTDTVVDNFVPQIMEQAAELYGRGLPKDLVTRISLLIAPIMPSVKDKTREVLPGFIKKQTEQFDHIPFALMVLGSERYLDIKIDGDNAVIVSKLEDHSFEVVMIRKEDHWQITGVKDAKLARQIAETFGQQFIKIAAEKDIKQAGKNLGIENFKTIIESIEGIFN